MLCLKNVQKGQFNGWNRDLYGDDTYYLGRGSPSVGPPPDLQGFKHIMEHYFTMGLPEGEDWDIAEFPYHYRRLHEDRNSSVHVARTSDVARFVVFFFFGGATKLVNIA